MTTFIENKLLYHEYQSGYQKNNSTKTWFLKKKVDIDKEKALECCKITLSVFRDCHIKAFDTNNFNILIKKLTKLHFSKTFLYFILDYQIEPIWYKLIPDFSDFSAPQGSILGPALFNLCVADM